MKLRLLSLLACVFMMGNCWAQDYPIHSIRLIVPYTPGGPADIVARLIAQKVGAALGQPIVVENRGGADGAIGSEIVAKASPDGYTLLFGTIQTHGVNPSLVRKLSYDPVKDFVAVASATSFPFVLVVTPSVPAHSVAELIKLARQDAGHFNYSSAGTGSGTNLAGEMFKSMAHVDILHVPFKGGGEALTDVLAGRIKMTFTGVPSSLALIKDGKLRALAVTGTSRLPVLPDVPTVAETLPGFDVRSWNGFFAPAGTPATVVEKLNREIVRVLGQSDVKGRLDGMGAQTFVSTPAQFSDFVRNEVAKWKKVMAAAGIAPQ